MLTLTMAKFASQFVYTDNSKGYPLEFPPEMRKNDAQPKVRHMIRSSSSENR